MVENPVGSDLVPSAYINVMRILMEEALEIGFPLPQAKEQAQKILQPPAEKTPYQEKPHKKAA